MNDINYVREQLMNKIDEMELEELLKLKIMLYIHKSLESEETLDNNCKVLDMNKNRRK
jgi:hypothetical protein